MFRRRGGPRHGRTDDAPRSAALARSMDDEDEAAPERGPYDVRHAPRGVDRIDFGSLQIPRLDGVEVRIEANPADGTVTTVVLFDGTSALGLGVFAAPRTEGIWAEVREETASRMAADGIVAREIRGRYGVELVGEVKTPEGPVDVRLIGVDGPRWLVRGTFQGPAAADHDHAGPLVLCLEGVVVVRDEEARPPGEPLPLSLPKELIEQAQAQAAAIAEAERQEQERQPGRHAHPPTPNGRHAH